MATSPFPFFPTTTPAYVPTTVFPPPPVGFGAPAYTVPCFTAPPAFPSPIPTQIDPNLSPATPTPIHGDLHNSPFPFFYSAPPTFPYPPPASAYTPASGFYPNQPIWPPPAPDPISLTTTSTTYANSSTASHFPSVAQLLEVHDPNDAYSSSSDRAADACRRRSVTGVGFGSPASQLELPSTENPILAEIEPVISAPAAALIVLCSGPGPERRPSSPSSAPVPAPSATQARRPTPPTTNTPSAPDEQEAEVLAAAQAQAREEEEISTRLPREVINLRRRLDNQQNTIDAIQGSLSNLTEMVGQIALTLKLNPNPTTSSPATTAARVLSTCSSSLESTGTAYVAPMVFGQMPIPLSGYEHYGDGYQNPNPIQSSPVHVGSTNLHEQHVDEVPQSYCLHNLNSQRVFLADDGCSNEFVPVFASTPEQQSYEEDKSCLNCMDEQLATPFHKTANNALSEQLLTCFSKAPETEESSACLNMVTDVLDVTLEREQLDDEKACNCPLLKASDSYVTRSNKLSSAHVVRGLRLIWDPGDHTVSTSTGENVGVTASQSAAAQTAALALVYCSKTNNTMGSETMLVHNLQLPMIVQDYHNVTMKMHVSVEKNQESEQLDTCLHKASGTASHEQVKIWKQRCDLNINSGCSLKLGTETCISKFSVATSLPFLQEQLQQVHTQEYNLMLIAEGIQDWDPGIDTPSSTYFWLQGLNAMIATGKPLSWLQISELATWQSQATNGSYVWDPGTMLPWYRSTWWLLFTEEMINQHHDIKCYGVALWFIHFLPP